MMRGLMVAMAGAAAAIAASGAMAETPILPDAAVLDVSATAKVARTPDVATIRAGVTTQEPTAAAAMSGNAARMARVIAALRRAGVAERDLSTSSVSLAPQYRYAENQPPAITDYRANNTVSVRFRDIAKSGTILDALVAAGANQIDGPQMSLDKPEAALDEARTEAVRRARARADLYAAAAGMRVARIVSIAEAGESEGGPRPPVMYMARMSADAAPTQVLPGETEVSVTVSVRFELK